jgi:tight junction protein 1
LAHYNENGLYKRVQIESNYTFLVISSKSGLFDWKGGILESNETGVSLEIPENALCRSQTNEIYFKVCLCKSLDHLQNPIVLCGPRGLRFIKPVKLHIPLFKSIDGKSWSYVPRAHEFNDAKQSPTSVDVLIDYF